MTLSWNLENVYFLPAWEWEAAVEAWAEWFSWVGTTDVIYLKRFFHVFILNTAVLLNLNQCKCITVEEGSILHNDIGFTLSADCAGRKPSTC